MNLGEKKPLVIGVCTVAIVISLLSVFITQCDKPPKVDLSRSEAATEGLGKRLGQELAQGSKVVLVVMDPKIESPVFRAQTKGFERGLDPYENKIKIVERVKIRIDEMTHGMSSGMPNKVYIDVLRNHPEAEAIASLVGIPMLTDEEINQLPANVPRLYAMIPYNVGIKRAFEEGILSAAVVPRNERIEQSGDPHDSDALFNKYYRYITEQSYETLPY